jgi:hypothetical protein
VVAGQLLRPVGDLRVNCADRSRQDQFLGRSNYLFPGAQTIHERKELAGWATGFLCTVRVNQNTLFVTIHNRKESSRILFGFCGDEAHRIIVILNQAT